MIAFHFVILVISIAPDVTILVTPYRTGCHRAAQLHDDLVLDILHKILVQSEMQLK
jgi:hypothetical protein